MEFFIKASQLLTSLSILVILHELGHFIPAKLFKTRVEKFYLFFDPWFSVIKKKIGGTEYGIGWLPLGGYVKISGMIDESMDKEQMNQPPKPWEFRSKPAWQRLIIMSGGVIVNFLLAILLFSTVLFIYGERYIPNKNLVDGIHCLTSGEKIFNNGDKIISVDGKDVGMVDYKDVMELVLTGEKLVVSRQSTGVLGRFDTTISIPRGLINDLIKEKSLLYIPRFPTIIGGFSKGGKLKDSGFLVNDKIVSVNGVSTDYFDLFKTELLTYKDTSINFEVIRNGERLLLSAYVNAESQIGFMPAIPKNEKDWEKLSLYDVAFFEYSFLESFPAGYKKSIYELNKYIRGFKKILDPSSGAYRAMGGFASIGSLFPAEWDWEEFLYWTAWISLILAFMNILPIPALDGGHILFLLYEMIIGKPAPEKIIEYAQIIGIVLLLSLVAYANLNDIFRFL